MRVVNSFLLFVSFLSYLTSTNAYAEVEEFLGEFYGGRLGMNSSEATGVISAPGEQTLAYGIQGGYLQGGLNKKYGRGIVGFGVYADLHSYERHSNGIAYGGHAYGLDLKLALPSKAWLPYVKLGYGYSAGTGNMRDIKQFGFNQTLGGEYKFLSHWSVNVEYKINKFHKDSTYIENRTFMLGFNYYINIPVEEKIIEPEVIYEAPKVYEEVPPDFSPPP